MWARGLRDFIRFRLSATDQFLTAGWFAFGRFGTSQGTVAVHVGSVQSMSR
jgi:hypothetical protein